MAWLPSVVHMPCIAVADFSSIMHLPLPPPLLPSSTSDPQKRSSMGVVHLALLGVLGVLGVQEASRADEGTYNPKSAWMMVDSRRRVLPDIDGG